MFCSNSYQKKKSIEKALQKVAVFYFIFLQVVCAKFVLPISWSFGKMNKDFI